MKSSTQRIALALTVMLMFAGVVTLQLSGQSIVAGDITGIVTDPSGAIVPNATVTLKNDASGETQTTTTSSSGQYRFSLLRPGPYSINVKASGFQPIDRKTVVAVGKATRVDLPLSVTGASTTVEVTAQTPVLETENGNISTSYGTRDIELLPNPGGDITYVAQTAPGAIQNTGGGYGNFSTFGLPATSNLFTVNGNDDMDPYLNLNNSGATNLALGANELQEVTVVNNGYSGQYGRQAGSQVNYTTKYGTNAFHGNAIYWWNGRAMNANNWFNKNVDTSTGGTITDRPFVNANQWAASVGGPIFKDHTFFFVDTEGLRFVLPTNAQTFVPSTAFENAVLGSVPAAQAPFYQQIFNLYNSAPGAANAAPASAAVNPSDPTACGDFTGLPAGVPCANVFRSTQGNLSHEWTLSTRIDQVVGSHDKLFGRFRTDHGVQATFTDPLTPLFNAFSTQPQYEGQLNESHTFGNSAVNQLVISGSWYSAIFDLADPAAATAAFPFQLRFSDGNFARLGPSPSFPQGRNVTQYQAVDDFSVLKGRHNLKFGVNYRRNDINDQSAGVFSRGRARVFSLTDFASGIADQVTQAFPQSLSQPIALYGVGFYAQDQWKITQNFSLDLSLRIDHGSNPVCQKDCFSRLTGPFGEVNHDPTIPYNQVIQTGLHQAFPSLNAVLWQPRMGFAWSPLGANRNTVVRGGIGIFYDAVPAVIVDNFLLNAPGVNTLTDNSGLPLTAPSVPGGAFASLAGSNAAFQNLFASGGTLASITAAVPAFTAPDFNTVSNNIKTPQFQEWNLEVQKGFGNNTVLSLNYVGNHGIHIPVTNYWPNAFCDPAVCTTPLTGIPASATAPDPRFGTIAEVNTSAISNYNGLTVSFQRKFTRGFQAQVNYTWSHALDEVSNGGVNPFAFATFTSIQNQMDPRNLRMNYGNADYDARHNLNANFVWDAGFHFNNGLVNEVLGGWVFSGTVFTHSAYPFTVIDSTANGLFGNYSNAFGFFPGTVNTPVTTTSSGTNNGQDCNNPNVPCLNAANFSPLGSTGPTAFPDQRRNQFRGPHYFNADFSVTKNFRVTENTRFGVGANFFNVFNHPNFDFPDPDLASSTFGTIVSTVNTPTSPLGSFLGADASARIIQLHARFTF